MELSKSQASQSLGGVEAQAGVEAGTLPARPAPGPSTGAAPSSLLSAAARCAALRRRQRRSRSWACPPATPRCARAPRPAGCEGAGWGWASPPAAEAWAPAAAAQLRPHLLSHRRLAPHLAAALVRQQCLRPPPLLLWPARRHWGCPLLLAPLAAARRWTAGAWGMQQGSQQVVRLPWCAARGSLLRVWAF